MAAGMVPSTSRPEYMNATPHHSKLRVAITLSSTLFVAGEDVTGKMEMECRGDSDLGIGLIMAELFAVQELNSRDHSATSTFLHIRRLFQGPGLPPSNAVVAHPAPGQQPLPPGHFPARRGVTTFFFKFPLPLSSPSAISFASGLARVRYEVRASVSVAHRGEKRVVTDTADADVVQSEDMDGAVSEHVVVGENGKVYVQGRLLGGRLVSGQRACVELHVKNHAPKKTTGLSLTLTRALHLQDMDTAKSPPPLQLTDTLVSQNFRGAEYTIQPGAEGVASLVFDVPNAARVVKGGPREGAADGSLTAPLFELRCILSIRIGMGIASKDVLFEIPVQLSHPATLPSQPDAVVPPPPPNPPFARSPATGSGGSSPAHQHDASPHAYAPRPLPSSPPPGVYGPPPVSFPSPVQYYLPPASYPQQNFWSPSPPSIPYFVSSADLNHQYFVPPPPVPLIPFAHPARPSSAGAPTQLPNELPGVGVVPHDPSSQLQHHSYVASVHQDSSTQSQPHAEEQDDVPASIVEEGKGARASRIAQHLRAPTRARSASPTAHRFHMSAPAPVEAAKTVHNIPSTNPAALYATAPRNSAAPPVLSPRPVRSPRHSISGVADIGVSGSAPSEGVHLLERMVAAAPGDEGKSVAEVLRDLEKNLDHDKTLPAPPVPSSKERRGSAPRVRDLFAQHGDGAGEAAGAVGKKSVLRPSPMARRFDVKMEAQGKHTAGGGEKLLKPASSGLDALEQRLLYEVGTRKPDKSERPTILPLAPVTTSTPSEAPVLVQHDSEISTLALQGSGEHNTPASPNSASNPALSSPHKETQELRAVGVDTSRARTRTAAAAPEKGKEISWKREQKIRQQEAVKLRKEAKGRVADWLGGVSKAPDKEDTETVRSPQKMNGAESSKINNNPPDKVKASLSTLTTSPQPAVRSPSKEVPPKPVSLQSPKSPTTSSSQEVGSPSRSDKRMVFDLKKEPPQSALSSRSPRFASPTSPALPKAKPPTLPKPTSLVTPRLKPVQEASREDNSQPPAADAELSPNKLPARLPKFLSSPVSPQTKYDVRSARGGKGGITTSVAAMWSALANERSNDKPITLKPITPNKRPAFLDVGKAKPSPLSTDGSVNRSAALASSTDGATSPSGEIQQPRNMIKAASVPAAMVASHAKPHISSSASLARPAPGVGKITAPSLLPTLSETPSKSPSKKPRVTQGELAIGQARLRDLIKKYQQGAS